MLWSRTPSSVERTTAFVLTLSQVISSPQSDWIESAGQSTLSLCVRTMGSSPLTCGSTSLLAT
ncbi:hypothetical protein SRHO_G00192270 [Serrasalmus rhombeus]